jgi:DNA-binding CsgD family transcriptional regulator/PAS domain-containing protein
MPMQIDETRYLDLVSRAYEAALEPALWESLLGDLAATLQANAAACFFFDHRNGSVARANTIGIDPDCLRQYAEHYINICPRYLMAGRFRAGAVFTDETICPQPRGRFAEYYDFLERFDVDNCTGVIVEQERDVGAAIMVYRPRKGSPFETVESALLTKLHGHLRRAARLSLESIRKNETAAAHEALFENLTYSAILLDRHGDVLALNSRAEELLRRAGGHIAVTNRSLVFARRADQDKLKDAIAAALSPFSPTHLQGLPFLVSCPGVGSIRLSVIMLPTALAEGGVGFYGLPDIPCAMVALTELAPSVDPRLLQALFGLTRTEAELAARLASGQNVKAVAAERSVSEGTIRVQLKAVFAKLDVSSQAQLVGKVLMATQVGL